MGGWFSSGRSKTPKVVIKGNTTRLNYLNFAVLEARNLKAPELGPYPDPYVKVQYFPAGSDEALHDATTPVVYKNKSPVFDERFVFDIANPEDEIGFEVWEENSSKKNPFLGMAREKISTLLANKEKQWLTLKPRDSEDVGIRGELSVLISSI